MVRRVIATLFMLLSMGCFAEEAQFVREAVASSLVALPIEPTAYSAWAHTAATYDDQALLNVLFEDYRDKFFEHKVPTLEKLEALEEDFPTCDSLLNMLAWNRYRMGVDLEYALSLAKRIQNHTESTLDTLAVLKLKCGYPAEALQIFLDLLPEFQIQLPPNPNDKIPAYYSLIECIAAVTIYDHAADAFYKNGHLKEAAILWNETHQLIKRIQITFDFDLDQFPAYDFNYSRFQQKYKAIRTLLKAARATSEM